MKPVFTIPVSLAAAYLFQGCALIQTGPPPETERSASRVLPGAAKFFPPKVENRPKLTEIGQASWYGPGFQGKKTASGEAFDQKEFTAAHRTLPLGSKVRVVNLDNDKSVEVEINDRGPYVGGRIIDLSRAAAKVLGMLEDGITRVRIEVFSLP